MLDIKFLRENPDVVKQNIKNKFQDRKLPLVDQVIELDKENREIKQEVQALRADRNKLSKQIGALMGQTKKMPVRTCTGCRQAKNKKDLIRVVRDKEGNVSVDATGKLNGRGAYICPDKECLKKAIKNKGLEKTLKISGIGEEIYSQLEKELGEINE